MTDKEIASQILSTFPLFMNKIFHDFRHVTGEYDLNKTQVKALIIIHMDDNPHMTHVCHHMNMEKGSLTPVVDSLIEIGLVERKRNREDRRKVNLSLTERGKKLVVRNLNRAHEHILKKIGHLPEDMVDRFKRAVLDLHEIAQKL
jgi:DNA-binding MarR family transcriptional regulator